jgi:serine/threonine protein kinase
MSAVPAATTLGRFELRRKLGQGAQATVWLAFDPRLEREVAVKVLRGDEPNAAQEWLHEARAVSRLAHPHVVPVFEADVHGGRPYLVFEHVAGGTLAERLKRDGAMSAPAAVDLMLGVLDALGAAHAAGVVHRDLKPSNVLLDGAGRARVMDFGIAARLDGRSHDGSVCGTPGYISPEAARGEVPTPSMDLFAAGLMLVEMIDGKPLRERDPDVMRAVRRAAAEAPVLPATLAADDALRGVLLRALALDPALRFASARAMRDALAVWIAPAEPVDDGGTPAGKGALEFLLRRMRHKSDFPALSDAIARIQRVANSDSESLNSLAGEILKDVALTNKLLRLVNTAGYSHAGGGSISTVSRAVALVGFAGIRNLALSLLLLEHMRDKAHAQQLQQEFLRSLMAGSLASELSANARDGEEVFIGAMLQNLGRMLTGFYFPEEAAEVRKQSAQISEATAAQRVLGIGYLELGLGVAKNWGLPESLQRIMRRPDGEPPARAVDAPAERQRWLAAAANDVADVLLAVEPQHAAARVADVAQRYAKAIGADAKQVAAAVESARAKLQQMVQGMALQMPAGSPSRRLLGQAPVPAPAAAPDTEADVLAQHELQATLPAANAVAPPSGRAADTLVAGIADITNTMASDGFRLNEVLRMILETMYRALGFRRVVFCLRDARLDALTGRFGLGDNAAVVAKEFRIALRTTSGQTPDLFTAVCLKGADTLITDARVPGIAQRLPPWFRARIDAPAFLLLPLAMKNAPFALIYADKAVAGAIDLGEKELSLLRTLRNQAVMAFRQAG